MNKILLISSLIILNINILNAEPIFEQVNTKSQQLSNYSDIFNKNKRQPNNNPNETRANNNINNPNMFMNNLPQNQMVYNNNQVQYTPNTLEIGNSQQQANNNIIETQQQFSLVDNLIDYGDKHIRELFPENAYGMFNNPVDINKYNQDTLRVDFKLTQEMCEAILKKDSKLLMNIILNSDSKYLGAYKDILGKQIEHMLEKFFSINDLKFIINYLTITGGEPFYTPALSMQNWLNSLECINEIKEVAIPFLEEVENNRSSQSYELRISFYFRTNNSSEIFIPKAEQLSLLTQLKQIENNINVILNEKKERLKIYQNEITAINLNKEIQNLKQDKNIITLENINTDIKTKTEEKNKMTNEKNEKLKNNRNNYTAQSKIKKEYDDKIKALDDELKNLQDKKNELEKEFEPLIKQMKEKEEQYQQMKKSYERTIGYVEVTIDQSNDKIKKQLEMAKSLFESNKMEKNNNIPL